jgi:hypothetical protein
LKSSLEMFGADEDHLSDSKSAIRSSTLLNSFMRPARMSSSA